jgi:uncharacterized CHY-type Zn-finger protein
MSGTNIFNGNLTETPINIAYKFNTCSNFIKNMKLPEFSSNCIFCSCRDSISLNQEGSFRQCRKCNKQFKAAFSNNCTKT